MFHKMNTVRLRSILAAMLLISVLLSGCAQATPKAEPTAAATATSAPTNTPKPTDTPVPTATATNTPVPTATATATPDAAATQAAAQAATEQALVDIVKPDLEAFGIDPKDGHVAWVSKDDINLEATSYQEEKIYQLDEVGKVADFVLKTRVTWNSTGGLAGCGIKFRAADDLKMGGHYEFLMMRLQFQPYWDFEFHQFNQWQYTFTATGKAVATNKLDDEKNSSNDIALVARGKQFTVYFNGAQQRPGENNKLADGNIVLVSWQDSGKTTCKYADTWVWVFDK